MKVISIIQPWATLIAIGEKKFEARSWSTKHRGELGIHASKKIDKSVCRQEPFRSVLAKHGYNESNLPTGVILGTCRLADCLKVVEGNGTSAILEDLHLISGNEYAFGDYSEGRFAWGVKDVGMLTEYVPAKGKLNLWEYPLAEMVGDMR